MATDDDGQENPFTRPGFIAAAVVIALVVVLGIVLVVVNARDDDDPGPTPSSPVGTSAAPTTNPTVAAGGESVCGLTGEVLTGTLTTAPDAEWEYQGTIAYPTSTTYGPGDTTPEGVRHCFQHSPEGALFAAANAVVQGSDAGTVGTWLEYFIAEGPHREAVLSAGAGSGTSRSGVRLAIAGFRVLAYDGETARIDVAVRGGTGGQTVNLSMMYALAWENGDWKLAVSDPSAPIDVASLPDVVGYVSWGPGS